MKERIKKILRENDFDWTSNSWNVDDLPIKDLDKLMEYYDGIHIKNKLGRWLKDKKGGEVIHHIDNSHLSQEESMEKFKNEYIVEHIRMVHSEVYNIDASLFQLPDELAELEKLITGTRGSKYDEWYKKRL